MRKWITALFLAVFVLVLAGSAFASVTVRNNSREVINVTYNKRGKVMGRPPILPLCALSYAAHRKWPALFVKIRTGIGGPDLGRLVSRSEGR